MRGRGEGGKGRRPRLDRDGRGRYFVDMRAARLEEMADRLAEGETVLVTDRERVSFVLATLHRAGADRGHS